MKISKKLYLFALFVFTSFFISCDLVDSLKTYPVNVPISIQFSASGTSNTVNETEYFCVDNQEAYQEYKDNINKVTFVEMAFRTISYSPSNLQGNVTISLKDAAGTTLFSKTIPDAKASDYVTTPYILQLNQTEIQAVNNYLDQALQQNQSLCFTANISINITQGGTTNSISGALDVVFEAQAEL